MKMIRTVITNVVEGVIKRFSGTGRANETITDREVFQHYGFTSMPLNGAEGILINEKNHIVLIASDDRRYRIPLQGGEVAIYNADGDYVKLGQNRKITVVGGTSVTVQTPSLVIEGMAGGETNVQVTGNAALTGNLAVTGNITYTGTCIKI
jgi:phage baseplate assembly protein V